MLLAQAGVECFRQAGMPAMVLDYWNVPGTPKDDGEIPVEYVSSPAMRIRKKQTACVGMWGIPLAESMLCFAAVFFLNLNVLSLAARPCCE